MKNLTPPRPLLLGVLFCVLAVPVSSVNGQVVGRWIDPPCDAYDCACCEPDVAEFSAQLMGDDMVLRFRLYHEPSIPDNTYGKGYHAGLDVDRNEDTGGGEPGFCSHRAGAEWFVNVAGPFHFVPGEVATVCLGEQRTTCAGHPIAGTALAQTTEAFPQNYWWPVSFTSDSVYICYPLCGSTTAGPMYVWGASTLNLFFTHDCAPDGTFVESVSGPLPALPPGVPYGAGDTEPLLVAKNDPVGLSPRLRWDTSCGAENYHLLYGWGSQLPDNPGDPFPVLGAECDLGPGPEYVWDYAPDDWDPTGLQWFFVVAGDGASVEGAWGPDGEGNDRSGLGPGGSSGLCGYDQKSLVNTCGQ